MSVQFLSSDYISKINPQQVEQWVRDNKIERQGNQYIVKDISFFPETCLVQGSKGITVEHTAPESKGEVIGTPKTNYHVNISSIINTMGLTDETLQAEFKAFVAKNLSIDENGEISFNNEDEMNQTLALFANEHKDKFVDANSQKYVEFTEDSDEEAIARLQEGDNPAIYHNPINGGRRYAVQNMDALTTSLSEQVGETTYEEAEDARTFAVEAGVTTTTTKRENILDVPANLRGSKAARKTLEKDARAAYADFVATADPQTRDAIDLYVAERKYDKQINKKMRELSTYKAINGDGTSSKQTRDTADIVQYYIDNYADNKDELNQLVSAIKNSSNSDDQAAILEALKKFNLYGVNKDTKFEEIPDDIKHKGALICLASNAGYSSDTLLRLMAIKDVMGARSARQIEKDNKYFAKEQAKDFVKNKQAEQDVLNTTVFFSKAGRKNAPEDGKIHTDIGDKGRRLVLTCPTVFCNEVSKDEFNTNEDGYFSATIGGQEKYFKFDENKWKTFTQVMCDPRTATDEQLEVLFGKDHPTLADKNMTLQEARKSLLLWNLTAVVKDKDGGNSKLGTRSLESIIGNGDTAASNREVNALRDMVESAGYSVDSNTTAGKRLLHILKNAGIGTGMGLLTGGLGSLLSGAVTVTGETAGQMVSLTGPTSVKGMATLGYRDNVVTTDYYTDEYGTTSVTHNTPVSGTTTGEVTINGEGTVSGHVDGQEYQDRGNNHWDNARNAGILGGIAGITRGLVTMRGVQERGRNVDDIFDLTRLTQDEVTENKTMNLKCPKFNEVQTRKGEITVEAEIPTLKAVAYRGPSAYNGLYKYEDGTPVSPRDFARAYQAKVNGKMTDFNFFVFPELEVNGKKIVPVDDYEEQYKKITPGRPGGQRGVKFNGTTRRTVRAQGTIK